MTTKVTIDAHAGWPILVGFLRGEANDTRRTRWGEARLLSTQRTKDCSY